MPEDNCDPKLKLSEPLDYARPAESPKNRPLSFRFGILSVLGQILLLPLMVVNRDTGVAVAMLRVFGILGLLLSAIAPLLCFVFAFIELRNYHKPLARTLIIWGIVLSSVTWFLVFVELA
jgi:hypothetical protein